MDMMVPLARAATSRTASHHHGGPRWRSTQPSRLSQTLRPPSSVPGRSCPPARRNTRRAGRERAPFLPQALLQRREKAELSLGGGARRRRGEINVFQQGLRYVGKEARGSSGDLLTPLHPRRCARQEQTLTRTGDPDVAEAPLLLEILRLSLHPRVGKGVLLQADQKNDAKLEALRRVQRHQGHAPGGWAVLLLARVEREPVEVCEEPRFRTLAFLV